MLTQPTTDKATTLTITTLYPNGYCMIATLDLTDPAAYHKALSGVPTFHDLWINDAECASEASWSLEAKRHTIKRRPCDVDGL